MLFEQLNSTPQNDLELEIPSDTNLVRTINKNALVEAPNLDPIEETSESFFSSSIQPKCLPFFDFNLWKDYSQIMCALLQNHQTSPPAGNFKKNFF